MTHNLDTYFRVTRQVHVQVVECLFRARENTRLVGSEEQVLDDEYLSFLDRNELDIEGVADISQRHIECVVTHLRNVDAVLRTFLQHLACSAGSGVGSQAVSRFGYIAAEKLYNSRNGESCLLISYAYAQDGTGTQCDGNIFGRTHFLDLKLLRSRVEIICLDIHGKFTQRVFLTEAFRSDLFLTHGDLAALGATCLYESLLQRLVGIGVNNAVDSICRGRRNGALFLTRYLKLNGELGSHEEVVEFGISVHRQQGVGVLYLYIACRKLHRSGFRRSVGVQHTVFRKQRYAVVDILAAEGQTLTRFYFGFLCLRIRLFLQPLIEVQTDLGSYADIRLGEYHFLFRHAVEVIDTHSVRINQSRVVDNDIVLAFLAVTHRQTIMYFGANEEIIAAELRTEHQRNADLQHVTHLAQVVEIIIVGCTGIGLVNTLGIESVCRGGVQEAGIQTYLKEEMAILEVVGKVNTYTGTSFELLECIALVERTGTHVTAVDLIHHGGVTCAHAEVEIGDDFGLGVSQILLVFLIIANSLFFLGFGFRLFLGLSFCAFFRSLSAFGSRFFALGLFLCSLLGSGGFLLVRLFLLVCSRFLLFFLSFRFCSRFLAFLGFFLLLRSGFRLVVLCGRHRLRHCVGNDRRTAQTQNNTDNQ